MLDWASIVGMSDALRARADQQVDAWLAFHARVEPIDPDDYDGIDRDELDELEPRLGFALPPFYKAVMARLGLVSELPTFVDGFEFAVDYPAELIERAAQPPREYFFVGANAQILNEYAVYYDLGRWSADEVNCELAWMIVDPYTGRVIRNVPMYESFRDLLWFSSFHSHWISTKPRHVEWKLEAPARSGVGAALEAAAADLGLERIEGPGASISLSLGPAAALAASRAPRQTELRVMLGCGHDDQIAEVQARLGPWISSARQSRSH